MEHYKEIRDKEEARAREIREKVCDSFSTAADTLKNCVKY